ncbi:MAG: septum formation protein Maf [Verrucomicrobia bacterium]|nr:septum formation protein Maf [Verrucomicrobiota bacterium]
MKLPPLILASASPRRSELLRELGEEFRVEASRVPELEGEHLSPHEICRVNAYRKAREVSKRFPDSLVIGADTEVALAHEVFGKPADFAEAAAMLRRLQGRTHEVVTGVCLIHLREHRQKTFSVSTSVTFRPLDAATIRLYLSAINPLDKAGAYAIQEQGSLIVESYSGSFTNVMGLPLEELRAELAAW